MITSDAGLEITRTQLRRAESILESYRRDYLPHNPVQYRLFSGTTIDLIRSLRADIDAYLEICPDTDLTICLEGESVALGSISAGIVTRTIDTFRRGLQNVVGTLNPKTDTATLRNGWIERLCDLSLAGLGPGGVQVFLDFPTNGEGLFNESDRNILKQAVSILFDGLEWAAQEESAMPPALERLPQSTQRAVLGVVAGLLPSPTGPVERITYGRRHDGPSLPARSAMLTRQCRQRIRQAMEHLAGDRKFTEAEGVIRQIDLDAQTFVLRERVGEEEDLHCEYGDGLAETVKELLDSRVKVSGLLETSRMTRRSKLEAETIEPVVAEEGTIEQEADIASSA